uniref:Uncharacterized protein n=1 Tax=viral metagenome TaxID=1070528 RepID=A0A6H1ZJG3_9ZZZZ
MNKKDIEKIKQEGFDEAIEEMIVEAKQKMMKEIKSLEKIKEISKPHQKRKKTKHMK